MVTTWVHKLPISALLILSAGAVLAQPAARLASFEADWRFLKGDAPGAEKVPFDDSAWRKVAIPHDWSIEGPFNATNSTGPGGAFLPAGVGWYRKHFTTRPGGHVLVEFEGVMANSDVWINGFHLGKRPNGYVSFTYDLTGHLEKGDNVLAVRADNSQQPASRWYTGAGIYRRVRLVETRDVHVEHGSTVITTPRVTAQLAAVHVVGRILNEAAKAHHVVATVVVNGPGGTGSKQRLKPLTVGPHGSVEVSADFQVPNPDRWDIGHGTRYFADILLNADGETSADGSPFGIREFHFDPDTGFWLNGRNLKIKGAALHHDGGAVGAAVPIAVWERRLNLLRQIGVNAIRTAHNPPSPEFLDLTDRMGFLVMDEMFDQWTIGKNPYDYHLYFNEWSKIDTRDTVRRDRNHPSVIVYSAGNEIRDTPKADLARQILSGLVEVFHQNDPTRPVTQALFRPNVSHDYDNGLADLLDVVGQNYRENEILAAHTAKPTRKILGTENRLDRAVWLALRDNPPYSGQFLWAGFDYLGEAHQWPQTTDDEGLFDRTGGFKPAAYERQSWWSDQPMVYMVRRVAPPPVAPTDPGYQATFRLAPQVLFPDWNPADASAHEENVEVYSNCQEVELMLNGKSLGSKTLPPDASPRTWRVAFAPGNLQAIGRNGGKQSATYELRTAGAAARISLSIDPPNLRPEIDDTAHVTAPGIGCITARIEDANGVLIPGGDALIAFHVDGPGAILAVDNADVTSHEPFQASERHAFRGQAIAILRRDNPGPLTVTATAPGLPPARLEFR